MDFLNLVMTGIKRLLAMKAMHSCSIDRTIQGGAERFTSSFLLITKKLMNEIRQYFTC